MDSSIYEVRLIHAFTALENIIASNLEESENSKLFLPPDEFKKLIKDMKIGINSCIKNRFPINV
jgi:hypothetical protein